MFDTQAIHTWLDKVLANIPTGNLLRSLPPICFFRVQLFAAMLFHISYNNILNVTSIRSSGEQLPSVCSIGEIVIID
jgi:hypothetical protein